MLWIEHATLFTVGTLEHVYSSFNFKWKLGLDGKHFYKFL